MADSTVTSISSSLFQPAVTFSGLGSGIDSQSIIDQLVEVESRQIEHLESWKAEWTEKITALQELNVKLTDLQSAVTAMDTPAEFLAKTVASSDTTVVTATAAATAAAGSHQVEVNQLAQNEIEVHAGLSSTDTVVNASGTSKVFAFTYAGSTVSVTVPDGATLEDLADAINASGANPGVTALVLDMGSSYTTDRYRLMLQGNDTGSDYTITIDDTLTTLDGTDSTEDFTSVTFTQSQAAQNAQLRLDGYPPGAWIERASNQISDLITGVTLTLHDTSTSPVTLTVSHDTTTMQEKIQDLVTAYNEVVAYIREQTQYDSITGEAGVLDETSSTFGQLLVDEDTLASALSSDPQGVGYLMAASFRGVSDDDTGNITYYSSLPGGTYQVSATVSGGTITNGTINGHPATIDGDTLTGAEGYPEYGLAVRINLVDGTYTTASLPRSWRTC